MAREKVPAWVLPDASEPPPAPEPSFLDNVGQYTGVTARALAPYATAATLGAAAGAPFAAVGAPIGAAGAGLALGVSDIGTGIYNMVVPRFGGPRIPSASETIQNAYESIGVGRRPETPAQQVYSDVVQAGAGGGSQVLNARTLAPFMTGTRGQNVMNFLAKDARGQTGAAIGGAAAPSIAANYFGVTDPSALLALSLAGGVTGGKAATPKPNVPTMDNLNTRARALYDQAKNANVRISQPALAQLDNDINTSLNNLNFVAGSHPEVRGRLAQLRQEFRGPIDFARLDSLHSDIAAQARRITNDKTRMYMEEIAHRVDDLITDLNPSQTTSPNSAAAMEAVTQARGLWRQRSQLKVLDTAFTAARNRAEQATTGGKSVSFGAALRSQFSGIVNTPRVFSRLAPELQDAVTAVANGTATSRTLGVLSRLSPTNFKSLTAEALIGGGAAYLGGPMAGVGIPAALMLVGGAAKSGSNRMAVSQGQRARAVATGTPVSPPFYRGPMALPTAQQVVQAPRRGEIAQQRRDTQTPPWWAYAKLP